MAPERCFGDTYRNVIMAFTENCQENQNGASAVGAGFGCIIAANFPKQMSSQSLIYWATLFPSFRRLGLGAHIVQADGPKRAGFEAATASPGPHTHSRPQPRAKESPCLSWRVWWEFSSSNQSPQPTSTPSPFSPLMFRAVARDPICVAVCPAHDTRNWTV